MSGNSAFRADFAKLLKAAGDKAEMVVRQTALDLQSQMIERSPVGDPSGWKANAGVISARTTYADAAAVYNDANPGKRRMGNSKQTLNKKFKLKVGADYTGGRFKGNWQVGIGAINMSTDSEIDKGGSATKGRTKEVLKSWKPGQTIFLCNSMPYSAELERGHSKQAPLGMVRLTVQNYALALAKAVSEVK